MAEPETPAGAIYDIGYQHYDGKRLGRAGAVRALYVHGIRAVFGLGRGPRAKIPPIVLIAFMVVPAVIQSAINGLVPGGIIRVVAHESYFRNTVWLFGMFCAFQTPELITSDQQYRVLPLYFSRALLRSDYVLARIGSLATSLLMVGLLPHVILLIGRYMAAEAVLASIRASLPLIPRIVGAALLVSLLFAVVSITIASMLKRRPFATAAILASFLLTSAFTIPIVMEGPQQMHYVVFASPTIVGDGLATWLLDTTNVAAADSVALAAQQPTPNERRRRRRNRTIIQAAALPGVQYLGVTLAYLIVAAGILTLRYRRIET